MALSVFNRYHFRVEWGGTRIGFSEVSGLNIEIEAVVFRDDADVQDSPKLIPGLRKFSNITLKREIVKGDNEFFNWINTKQIEAIERRDITVALLDENHEPVVIWSIRNSFPVHYYGPILNANDDMLAMETLVLAHEGITVQTL